MKQIQTMPKSPTNNHFDNQSSISVSVHSHDSDQQIIDDTVFHNL